MPELLKIALTIPSFAPHGGIRVIMEWANRLAERHQVGLFCRKNRACSWFNLNPRVQVFNSEFELRNFNRLIICSPHDISLASSQFAPGKKFIFLQMLEHLFSGGDDWNRKCAKVYSCDLPIILISKWNREFIKERSSNSRKIFYIGNGVNLDDFPIEEKCRKERAVLVEGWNALNPTKDVNCLGPKVADRLKKKGYRILAYAQNGPRVYKDVPDEFYVRPSLEEMNDLYRRAKVLIKATICDARSCSPMEAMTKGTVTARAINNGDDDLVHNMNCLKVPYDEDKLFISAWTLLKNNNLREVLSRNCIEYVRTFTWDYWMEFVEDILR